MDADIQVLTAPTDAELAELIGVLDDVVAGGASVGFLLPIDEAQHAAFWRGVAGEVAAGTRVLLVARDHGRIVGTVQLELAQRPNGRHRCELQKLLVRRSHRRRGIATALLRAAEEAARAHRRSLIVLDSGATGNALGLYDRGGYTRVGVIPRFANDPDGPLIDTVIYYKELPPLQPRFHLAQVNIARLKAPLDSPLLAGFVARIAEINALADGSRGFVWRLQEATGNATYLRPYDDDRILFNLSVWETPDALRHYVYRTAHAEVLRQRAAWCEQMAESWLALWWVPVGHTPTVAEAKDRLAHLRAHGETPQAFSFRRSFPSPGAEAATATP